MMKTHANKDSWYVGLSVVTTGLSNQNYNAEHVLRGCGALQAGRKNAWNSTNCAQGNLKELQTLRATTQNEVRAFRAPYPTMPKQLTGVSQFLH